MQTGNKQMAENKKTCCRHLWQKLSNEAPKKWKGKIIVGKLKRTLHAKLYLASTMFGLK